MNDFVFEDEGLLFEIPEHLQAEAWQQSSCQVGEWGRWNAYLNGLCLKVLLPWIAEETGLPVKSIQAPWSLPALWEFVNGTPLKVGRACWVLLPDEQFDDAELSIPEEWVSIPTWVPDYYLGVHVNLVECTLKIWGSVAHGNLMTTSRTEDTDRSRSLSELDIVTDPGLLWVQLSCLETASQCTSIHSLTQPENAHLLMKRLASAVVPRLELPLHLWLPLFAHGGRRQELFELRSGRTTGWSPLRWLSDGITGTALEASWRVATLMGAKGGSGQVFQRTLVVAGQLCELRLISRGESIWRLQLQPTDVDVSLGADTVLRLFDANLQSFEGNEDRALAPCPELYVEFGVESGDGIVWEIEPTPEEYTQEILRF